MPGFEDPHRPVCMACAQARRPVSIETGSAASWHKQCPGWFGGYAGVPAMRCLCGCPTSKRRGGDDG